MQETQTQSIYRTRNREKAIKVASELARLTNRCFQVAKFDSRTLEIVPQRHNVPVRDINAYRKLATAVVAADQIGEN